MEKTYSMNILPNLHYLLHVEKKLFTSLLLGNIPKSFDNRPNILTNSFGGSRGGYMVGSTPPPPPPTHTHTHTSTVCIVKECLLCAIWEPITLFNNPLCRPGRSAVTIIMATSKVMDCQHHDSLVSSMIYCRIIEANICQY